MSFYIAMLVIWSPEMINCPFTYIDILPRFVKNIVFQSSLLKFDSESLSWLDILFHNFVFFLCWEICHEFVANILNLFCLVICVLVHIFEKLSKIHSKVLIHVYREVGSQGFIALPTSKIPFDPFSTKEKCDRQSGHPCLIPVWIFFWWINENIYTYTSFITIYIVIMLWSGFHFLLLK